MFKFKNVVEFNKFVKEMFGFGLGFGFEDFKNFVGDNEFEIDLGEEEDMILILNNKKYYVVENFIGVKFVEVKY